VKERKKENYKERSKLRKDERQENNRRLRKKEKKVIVVVGRYRVKVMRVLMVNQAPHLEGLRTGEVSSTYSQLRQ